MSTSTAPRANQREHILDESLALMSTQGSAGMSMRQLAQACGVQVSAIYHYFPSKEALLRSVFEERRYSTRLAESPIAIDPSLPPQERLHEVFLFFWNGALEEEPVLRLLLGEALRSEPVALPTGQTLLDVFRAGVEQMVATHVSELSNVEQVAEVCISLVFSGFIRHIFNPSTPTDEIADGLARTLLATVF